MKILLILSILIILLPACTITKRHYRSGWYISFHGKQKSASKPEEKERKVFPDSEMVAQKSDTLVLAEELSNIRSASENELTDDTTKTLEKVVVVRTTKEPEKDSIRQKKRYTPTPAKESKTAFKLPTSGIVLRMIAYLLVAAMLILILIGILYIVEFASAISTGGLILLMLLFGAPVIMMLIYQICKLFNRKEPIIPDEKKRNRLYWLIAAGAMLLPMLLLAYYINEAF